jgi:hypothetical protein
MDRLILICIKLFFQIIPHQCSSVSTFRCLGCSYAVRSVHLNCAPWAWLLELLFSLAGRRLRPGGHECFPEGAFGLLELAEQALEAIEHLIDLLL